MKKDIEWLKKEIEEYLEYEGVRDARIALESVLGYIDQLDKPEVLSQEWIDDNKKDSGAHYIGYYVPIGRLHDLLVPKQDKPVIPKFVADWIDAHNLYGNNPLREYRDLEKDFNEGWADEKDAAVYHWVNKSPYVFIDALRYGYEVEKEKKYYVAFEDINLLYVTSVEVYGENEKLNYSSESITENAIKFIDKEKASSLAYFLGAIVVEATQ